MTRTNLDKMMAKTIRGNLFARIVGYYNRLKRDRLADRLAAQAAESRRAQEAIRLRTPAYQGTVIGNTNWINHNPPYIQVTDHWDLYETPQGVRSFNYRSPVFERVYDKHMEYTRIVLPWMENILLLDSEKLLSSDSTTQHEAFHYASRQKTEGG
jgi:hypothetical protein